MLRSKHSLTHTHTYNTSYSSHPGGFLSLSLSLSWFNAWLLRLFISVHINVNHWCPLPPPARSPLSPFLLSSIPLVALPVGVGPDDEQPWQQLKRTTGLSVKGCRPGPTGHVNHMPALSLWSQLTPAIAFCKVGLTCLYVVWRRTDGRTDSEVRGIVLLPFEVIYRTLWAHF